MKSSILEVEFKILKIACFCGMCLHVLKLEITMQRFFIPRYMYPPLLLEEPISL